MATVVMKKFQELDKHSSSTAPYCALLCLVNYLSVIVIVLYCIVDNNLLKLPKTCQKLRAQAIQECATLVQTSCAWRK